MSLSAWPLEGWQGVCSWVDNWFDDDISFQRNWIRQHASDGGYLGKPVCLFLPAKTEPPCHSEIHLQGTYYWSCCGAIPKA